MTTIEAHELRAGYGRVEILHDVSMTANAGEVTCIFGPNGCGKSTLLKALVGAIDTWGGSVSLEGHDITRLPSHEILRRGAALMPQNGGVFPDLTVLENLRMGGYILPSRRDVDERVEDLLDEFPRLRERLKVPAGSLSGGEQMMVAIARALLLRPGFILFDEPSAGLSPKLVGDVLRRAADLAGRGVGVVMVEQNIREAMKVADRMYVLAAGRNRFEGKPGDISDDRELMHMYLGIGKRQEGTA